MMSDLLGMLLLAISFIIIILLAKWCDYQINK